MINIPTTVGFKVVTAICWLLRCATDPPSANAVDDEDNDDSYDNENSNYKLSSENRTAAQTDDISVDGEADNKEDTNQTNKDAGNAAGFAKSTGTAAESQDTPNNPSTELKAKAGLDDTTKAQNDTRPPEDPKTNPKSAPTDVNNTSTTSEEGDLNEAQKLDGPGPKPVEDLAKENGGDAGLASSTSSVDKASRSPKEEEDKKEEDKDKDNENKGTGEKYVKSNGLKADGGDFDATQPGAGREADREFSPLKPLNLIQ
jgi:hypothetical protein